MSSIKRTGELLLAGQVVAIPTDTVYGLAASVSLQKAVEALYHIKRRPTHKPFVIQVASLGELWPFLDSCPRELQLLTDRFWPGPLTLVLPTKLGSRAFRIPNHPVTLALLQKTGPLFVTSANLSGKPPAHTAAEIIAQFGADFPILEGDVPEQGLPSTILEFTTQWRLIREGSLTGEAFSDLLPNL